MEERCRACVLSGGAEQPCVSDTTLRLYEQETGRPCPRVELEPALADFARLLPFIVREDLRPLAPLAFEAVTREWGPEERDELLRIVTIVGDEEVSRLLYLPPKELARQEREKLAEERKR